MLSKDYIGYTAVAILFAGLSVGCGMNYWLGGKDIFLALTAVNLVVAAGVGWSTYRHSSKKKKEIEEIVRDLKGAKASAPVLEYNEVTRSAKILNELNARFGKCELSDDEDRFRLINSFVLRRIHETFVEFNQSGHPEVNEIFIKRILKNILTSFYEQTFDKEVVSEILSAAESGVLLVPEKDAKIFTLFENAVVVFGRPTNGLSNFKEVSKAILDKTNEVYHENFNSSPERQDVNVGIAGGVLRSFYSGVVSNEELTIAISEFYRENVVPDVIEAAAESLVKEIDTRNYNGPATIENKKPEKLPRPRDAKGRFISNK